MWLIICSFYCFQFFVRVSPTVMSHELMNSFGVTAAALGVLTSSYYLMYAPLQLPLGIVLDRLGARRLATLSVAICALGCIIFSTAPNLMAAQIGRMLMGAGSASAFLSCIKVASTWLPPQKFGIAAGLTMMIGTLGASSASRPLALMIQGMGWRQTILLFACIGFLIAFLIFFLIKDRNPSQQADRQHSQSSLRSDLKEIIVNPQCWLVAIFTFLMYSPMGVFGDMWGVPYFMQRFCVDCVSASAPASMLYVGIAIGAPLMSWFSNRIQSRKIPLFVAAIANCVLFSFLLYGPQLSLYAAATVIFIAGFFLGGQMIAFTVICEINKIRLSGTAAGFNNSICMLSGVLFQPCVGLILDWFWDGSMNEGLRQYSTMSYNCGLGVIPGCALAAAIIALFIKDTYHRINDPSRMQ
jgi:sugar phosphate permease